MSVVIRLDTTRLDEITAEMRPRASQIIRQTAFEVQAVAQNLAPADTGALKSSIMAEVTGELSATVHDGVEYGVFVELGTSKMAAQPFLTPAMEERRADFNKRWAELFT